jgi:hypothetical protein
MRPENRVIPRVLAVLVAIAALLVLVFMVGGLVEAINRRVRRKRQVTPSRPH